MIVVRPASGDRLNIATGATEGGIVKRSLYLELLDGFRCRYCGPHGIVISYVVSVDAIDLVIVLGRARAIDRNHLRVAAHRGVIGKFGRCACRQPEDLREVARRQW